MRRGSLDVAALTFLPDLALGLDDAAGCHTVRDLVTRTYRPWSAVGTGTVLYRGSLARIVGELDLGCGDAAAAVTHFQEGLRIDARLGARPYLARGRIGLARALTDTGDLPAATRMLRAAANDAHRLHMPGLQADAASLTTRLAALKARAVEPLSPREQEVIALVARALPNREIARVLVLSERTVESHIRRILAKTHLGSRAELIRWHLENTQ
jgi:DNA-binding CsgD family transcriptional regulator